ncbi:hypothetical protein GCM10029976_096360 [Kribbella albertanoniae]|uniref:Uncharacterized protein n=1 Tax=Kribbella albertanoniae TaxID=1266829 RepID=A0A4R4QFP8_9ACTN|nr:hypothetical protein [Kribbella albertanoniae]TDC34354.1 hypothetical protein E1261_04155 [Kribbella albertanoniae]
MNLTTPPPVEHLDPGYAADVKHDLVRKARKPKRARWTPFLAWVPIVAATAAIAISTTTVVTLSRSGGGGSTDPAGPPGIVQVPPEASKVEETDLGPADEAWARAAAEKCLVPSTDAYGTKSHWNSPADAKTAKIRSARWVKNVVHPDERRQLLQSFSIVDEDVVFQCLDGVVLWHGITSELDDGVSAQEPVAGAWSWGSEDQGPVTVANSDYIFRATDDVERVQLRIRGTEAASPWYSTRVSGNLGYIAGVLPGAQADAGRLEVDLRAFDKAGKQVWSKTFG